ncbi:MAG: hypothetical protein IPM39_12260 [Chloroflexi bacterium]|nr:hypothetical protein [Chloroflexota bacterium]
MSAEANTGILDEQGNLRVEALNQGTILLRFTAQEEEPSLIQLVFTWIPDDPTQQAIRQVVKESDTDLGRGGYVECLKLNKNRGVNAPLVCLPKLWE